MKNSQTIASSHDENIGQTAEDEIRLFIAKHSVNALLKTERRIADIMHYEQVRDRVAAGEDLSGELPQLRTLSKADAVKAINALIKAKDAQAASFWDLPGVRVRSEVKIIKQTDKSRPRYDVAYTFTTKYGEVDVSLVIDGASSLQKISIRNVEKSQQILAYKSVVNQIDLMRLQ
jgi:hypothetical protein